ncbi:MAG: hypothetical protein SPL13_03070, partial [Clostridia bacterium]|nr:hypothetical protein [Clostridia bacterium]
LFLVFCAASAGVVALYNVIYARYAIVAVALIVIVILRKKIIGAVKKLKEKEVENKEKTDDKENAVES